MNIFIPENLKKFSENLSSPLYAVGGYVRNFIINGTVSEDLDIAADISADDVKTAAEKCGFKVVAEYKRTGTAVISDGERKYEYSRFRADRYDTGGGHKPAFSEFTSDITLDAKRRDFKCNAVYYDIKNEKIADPLCGLSDIKNKILDTVISPERVFCSDGLRLMRLARFKAELGFSIKDAVLSEAATFAENIRDISPERITDELKKILSADTRYQFSDKYGHYTGIKVLEQIGVFDILFPELAAGRGLSQRVDFHKYDVLEHSLRTLMYADKEVRLAALFHDVGKPYCKKAFGSYNNHAEAGERITKDILTRLKFDGRTVKNTAFLVRWHMFDLKNAESESAVRLFIAENRERIFPLLKLKQADYSAGKDDSSVCPTAEKWNAIYDKMKSDGTPFSISELDISAARLREMGFVGKDIGQELKTLFKYAVADPKSNEFSALSKVAEKDFERIYRRT